MSYPLSACVWRCDDLEVEKLGGLPVQEPPLFRTHFSQRVLTPSKVTAWLHCPHYLTLRARVDDGITVRPESVFGSIADLLCTKGLLTRATVPGRLRPAGQEDRANGLSQKEAGTWRPKRLRHHASGGHGLT